MLLLDGQLAGLLAAIPEPDPVGVLLDAMMRVTDLGEADDAPP